jgi:hypothetical protein
VPVTSNVENQWFPEVRGSVSLWHSPPPPSRDPRSSLSAKDDSPIIPIMSPPLTMQWCIVAGPTGAPFEIARAP